MQHRRIGRDVRAGSLAVVVAAAGLVCACSGATDRAHGLRDAPEAGGVLRIVREAPSSLDPRASDSVYEALPINQVFDTLLTTDASLNLKPGLAETWTISRDGTVYTFELRRGVRFHNGDPLTVDDVIFSLCRHLCPRNGEPSLASSYLMVIAGADRFAAGTTDAVAGLETLDEHTLRIRLARPYPSFLEVLTMENLGIVPRRVIQEQGAAAYGRAPVGTGPFRVAEWSERLLRLEANEDYFLGRPHIEALEITFLQPGENDFGLARFLDGQVDVVEPSVDALPLLGATRDVDVQRYQEMSLSFLGLNAREPPLDQVWLRRALAHALDRRTLVQDSPSARREAVGILPPGIAGYSPDAKALRYDPEESRRLLATASHPQGEGLPPIRLITPSTSAAAQRVIERIRVDLEAVGIRLEVEQVSWSQMGHELDSGRAPAFLLGWVADLTDPDTFLRSMFEADAPGNYFGHRSVETERLLNLGTREMNPVARARIYRRLERHILQQAPLVPLYHSVGVIAVRDRVQGLNPTPLGLSRAELERVWLHRPEGRS